MGAKDEDPPVAPSREEVLLTIMRDVMWSDPKGEMGASIDIQDRHTG
jgi:hypothetical protein